MAKLTVYGTPISVYVRVVRLLLEEIGAEYDLKSIDIFNGESQSAEYLAKNPFGKVPTLEVDGKLLYETSAITAYLDSTLANHRFSPSDPWLQAQMRQIMGIIDNYLYDPSIHTIVIQRLMTPKDQQPDEAAIKTALVPVTKALIAIESLAVETPYLLGSELSIADLYLIAVFAYFALTPDYAIATAETPKVQAWWNTASQLPIVKKVCA